ncbi:MAG TPA: CocE/NonD family hydrolase [Acidimicrobiia bacterium]|nr:CocE/NonD family hydrolase [Acidimicrobiia bacterium]
MRRLVASRRLRRTLDGFPAISRRRGVTVGVLALATALLGPISASAALTATPRPRSGPSHAGTADGYRRPPCREARPGPPPSVKSADRASDYDVTSFDGTRIRVHWFPNPAATTSTQLPTILKGPGWGSPGDINTTARGTGLYGDVNIADLWAAGYNVLTWDPRGFGKSGGAVSVDAPTVEGRDLQVLLDWVAAQPDVQLDAPRDPRVGMVGGSYGGGIQLVLAAIDCRVDAIVPTIAWHSLGSSLFKADTPKQGWGDALYSATVGHHIDPHITSAHTNADATATVSAADQAWFLSRGPADLVSKITAPTLFEQGTVDTLFTLQEAETNYRIVKAHGVPTAMIWYCGGHGVCLTKGGDAALPTKASLAWLERFVKDDAAASLSPVFTTVDQNGQELASDSYPPPAGRPVGVHAAGSLPLAQTTFVPVHGVPGAPSAVLAAVAGRITPTEAQNALDVEVKFEANALVLGSPVLSFSYSGVTPKGVRPTRVFAQLVDDSTGIVLGNQVTPIAVTLDGATHRVGVSLESIVFSAAPGDTLTLQLASTGQGYAVPRLGGHIRFTSINLSLPTAVGLQPR